MYSKCIRFSSALLHRGHADVVLRNLFMPSWKWYRPTMIRTTTWVRLTAFRLRRISCHTGCIRVRVPWCDQAMQSISVRTFWSFLVELVCPVFLDSLFMRHLFWPPLILARRIYHDFVCGGTS